MRRAAVFGLRASGQFGRKRRHLAALTMALATAFANAAVAEPVARPGLPEIQRPFSALPRDATFPVAKLDSDWVAIAADAVWVAGKGPDVVRKIDPGTNREMLAVPLPGAACAGLAAGFDSLWVPICGEKAYVVLRIDAASGKTLATIPMGPPAEGGIAAGRDAVWFVVGGNRLVGIDPATNSPARQITVADGSYVPEVDGDTVWVTSFDHDLVTAVDAPSGKVVATVPTGPKPRFLAAGGGAIWTLNQGDGSVTRIDAATRQPVATIPLGVPGTGGDISFGGGLVVVTEVGVPLTVIDAVSNRPLVQWVGPGGDSLRFGHGAIWLTDYLARSLERIDPRIAAGKKR